MQELAPHLLHGAAPDRSSNTIWEGSGDEVVLDDLESSARTLSDELEQLRTDDGDGDRDDFEGRVGVTLAEALISVPLEVLDDPGFWRFLAVEFFWSFVTWRESRAFESGDYGKYRKYIDGTNPSECVLLRAYNRARIAGPDGDYELARAIPRATDFWRSHVLRVRTSTAEPLARSFARAQADNRMPTDELRAFARHLNRLWTNIVLHTYSDDEAKTLIEELRESATGSEQDETASE